MPLKLIGKDFRQKDMDPDELKIRMMRKGVSQKDIANIFNPPVTNQAVNLVVHGLSVSHRIRQAIADALEMDIKRIWPSTYLYGGGPRKPGRPAAA